MAFRRGPNMVMEGLVLKIDAANPKSYPGSGNTVYDISPYGNINNLTISNFPFNSTNKVFESNGTSSDMYRNDAGSNEDWNINKTGQISIEYTVNYDSLTRSLDGGFSYGDLFGNSTNGAYQWNVSKSGDFFYFRIQTGGNNYSVAIDNSSIILGQLNHIVATYSNVNGSMKVYLNGVLVGQLTTPTGLTFSQPTSSRKKLTQSREGQYSFLGDLQTLAIYNKALSINEVLQNYNGLKGRFKV